MENNNFEIPPEILAGFEIPPEIMNACKIPADAENRQEARA